MSKLSKEIAKIKQEIAKKYTKRTSFVGTFDKNKNGVVITIGDGTELVMRKDNKEEIAKIISKLYMLEPGETIYVFEDIDGEEGDYGDDE